MARQTAPDEPIVLGVQPRPDVPSPTRSSKGPLIGLAAVLLIAAIALFVVGNRPAAEPTEAELVQAEQVRERSTLTNAEGAAPQLREPAARPERREPGQPLNELVPGFTDLLIVTHVNDQGAPFYQVLWAPGANAAARVSAFDDAVFDLSGNYFARFENSQWNGTMLAIGDLSSESSGPVAIGADAFVWHDTERARIAYTTEIEVGRRALFTADIVRRPGESELVIEYVTDIGGAQLVAWGDFGFVLQSDGEVIVLNPSGGDLGRAAMQFLGRDADGSLLVSQAGSVRRASLDLLELTEPSWAAQISGTVIRAVNSPYRPVAALEVQEPGGTVVYIASEADLVRLDLGEVTLHGWASGGQYLVLSRDEGRKSVLVFYDVDSDEVFELEMTDRVDQVFTRSP